MQLTKPLCFLDIESTGTDPAKDRIVSLAVIRYISKVFYPPRPVDKLAWIFNPKIPIPAAASAIHGITDEIVKDRPIFNAEAVMIHNTLKGCDLAGYNLTGFDIPVLWEEFYRAGIEWDLTGTRIIDAKNIFFKKEQRTLSAALKFYCGEEHEDAHAAIADTMATVKVLIAQLVRYEDLRELDVNALASFCQMEENPRIDLAGKLIRDAAGDAVYNFGKNKGRKLREDTDYAYWMLGKDFTANTKMAVKTELKRIGR